MFQAQANNYGKEVKLPWRAINQALSNYGAPGIDINSFGQLYDTEEETGPLHKIVNGERDRFDQNGIVLIPDNAPQELSQTEPSQGSVEQMAKHALKSK